MFDSKQWSYLSSVQKELDEYIMNNVQKKSSETFIARKVAFLVELSEFINEQRDFKYWSKKGPSSLEILLEEYIDGLHFLLSIGNEINFDFTNYCYQPIINQNFESLSEIFLLVFQKFLLFCESNTKLDFNNFLNSFLFIADKLNFKTEQLMNIYEKKHKINFERQQEGY